jgi:hypothetical protein
LFIIKEKKYNALGRRCICTKIRNPIAIGIFQGYLDAKKPYRTAPPIEYWVRYLLSPAFYSLNYKPSLSSTTFAIK